MMIAPSNNNNTNIGSGLARKEPEELLLCFTIAHIYDDVLDGCLLSVPFVAPYADLMKNKLGKCS